LTETTPRPDDDARAYYDSDTGRVILGPWLHSSQSTDNSYHEKVIFNVFDPSTEAFEPEPALRTGPPPGWTSAGTGSNPPYHQNRMMVLEDTSATAYVRAQKTIAALSSGVWALEVRIGGAAYTGGIARATFGLISSAS